MALDLNPGQQAGTEIPGLPKATNSPRRTLLWVSIAAVVVLVLGLAVPLVLTNRYYMGLTLAAAILSFHALSVGFLAKHLGLISLGHTAFFGGAAYCVGIAMTHWGWSPLMAALFGLVAVTVAAVPMGALIMRSSGMVFLMLTLALGQALHTISIQPASRDITGAHDGLQLQAADGATFLGIDFYALLVPQSFWPLAWVMLVVVIYLLWLVGRSRFGSLLEGIRENEERMRFSGFGTFVPRVAAFTLSGAVAGLGGVLFALNAHYVSPELLSFLAAGDALVSAIVGGLGALLGPVLGAFIYTFSESFLNFGGNLQLFMGALLVIVLVFFRGGIAGIVGTLYGRSRRKRAQKTTTTTTARPAGPAEPAAPADSKEPGA
ncbi:branched-chain amino acid ABC transporter permease [Citricoccus zhacaiensis]|uniref:Branched-chain amino acid ABC transporter permease n=1 Tax=Citricoccus zhacaiensis TaxID=489142 RepID=A0ABQ2LVG1_9MICC|nr:branched-chain amino acid ABC transporter permease [Citricoccus zhacaiensis]GGO43656.1 branched-chain amino acid ABC transporter permease [Citricoccus zhacaiensis]